MNDGLRALLPRSANATCPDTTSVGAGAAQPPASTSFRDALHEAARAMATREAHIDGVLARGGAGLGPEQLLALQATVQRHSREVELAAKLTDKLTGTVRQVLTSQQ